MQSSSRDGDSGGVSMKSMLCLNCLIHARIGSMGVDLYGGPNSGLAYRILRDYLDNFGISRQVLNEIAGAVRRHPTHRSLVEFIRQRAQEFVDQRNDFPTETELQKIAAKAVDDFRMPSRGDTGPDAHLVKPYFDGDLQQVISGIHGIGLVRTEIVNRARNELKFKGVYWIRDAYDFENNRELYVAYDTYRKELATVYATDEASFFSLPPGKGIVDRYTKDLLLAPFTGGNAIKGPLNKPLIYTAFMYALEMNDCTKSMPWECNIAFDEITLTSRRDIEMPIRSTAAPVRQDEPRPARIPKLRGPRPQPLAEVPKPQTAVYVVKAGDTLSAIAARLLGKAARWREIYELNKPVIGSNPNLIRPGQKLSLPER